MPNAKTEFFLTPQGRFCYPYLDQPRTTDMAGKSMDEPRYEVVLYLPKASADRNQDKTFLMLSQKVMEVVQQQFRGQWPQISPRGEWLDWPIDDCDADPQGLEKAPWGRGCWRIRLSGGKYPPKVVDATNNEIERDVTGRFRPGAFKGGDYGLASINCYGWEYSNVKKGVSFGLEGVKKTADGDSMGGGGRSAAEMFGAPTGPSAQPPAPPLPGGYAPPPASYAPLPASYQPPPPAYASPVAPFPPAPASYQPAPPQTAPAPSQPVYGGAPPQPAYGASGAGMPPAPPLVPPSYGPPIGSR